MHTNWLRTLPILKVTTSGIFLALVIIWIAPRNLLNAFQHVDLIFVFSAGMLLLAAQLLSSYKWLLIVRAEGGEFRALSSLRIYFIGMFINNFLPTGLGGDVSRALLAAQRANLSVVRSTWTVIFDRATGLLTLVIISWLAAGWYFHGVTGLVASIVLSLGGYLGLLAIRHPVEHLLCRLPFGQRLNLLLFPLRSPALWSVIALSFVFNVILITSVFLVGLGFGANVGWPFMAITTLVVSFSMLLPFFIGGYGAREAAFIMTLGYVGVGSGLAGAVGVTWGLLVSFVGLGGGVLLLISIKRRVGHSAAPSVSES